MKDNSLYQVALMLGSLLLFFTVSGIVSSIVPKSEVNNTTNLEEAVIEPENTEEQEILPIISTPIEQDRDVEETIIEKEKDEEVDLLWNYNEWDVEILALIIYQEAGGDNCSDETRIMVGNVFMNRVNSDRFPNTFEEVATQPNQYGLESGIRWPARWGEETERHAVTRAYSCAKRVLRGEKLLPENVVWQAQFAQGTGTYIHQDGLYFCY